MTKTDKIHEVYKIGGMAFSGADRQIFGAYLKSLRLKNGLNRGELAQKTKLSVPSIRDAENSTKTISEKTLSAFVKAYYDVRSEDHLLRQAGLHIELTDRISTPLEVLRERILKDANINYLPSLFEITERLPIAECYVDLYLAQRGQQEPNENQLVLYQTYAQKKEQEEAIQAANRLSVKDALDSNTFSNVLILGNPGTGKSSLMRKITHDICAQEWDSYDLAIFVEARAYWAECCKSKISVAEYAIRRNFVGNSGISDNEIDNLVESVNRNNEDIIFIIDGLDEVAGDAEATDYIYSLLEQRRFNWIASSRPAGLVKAPNETHRYMMAELSEDGIEALIENWANLKLQNGAETFTQQLTAEIFTSYALASMASNPFMLTAIIYLKSLNMYARLPDTKIALYETLIEKIGDQARDKFNDNSILNPDLIKNLADFAYTLFRLDEGPIQLFKLDHWLDKFPGQDQDFENRVLPARIIAEQFDPYRRFHFLHLTLQEHLIARHLLRLNVNDVLSYQHKPIWTNTFIHYAALLKHNNALEDFKFLVTEVYKHCDFAGAQLILLAHIFAACGIKNTRPWIGDDLRKIIFDYDFASSDTWHALLPSLGALDAEWFAEQTIEDLKKHAISFGKKSQFTFKHADAIQYSEHSESPFQLILKARSAYSHKVIKDAFWGDDEETAMLTIASFADIASRRDIDRISKILMQKPKDEHYFDRCLSLLFFNKFNSLGPLLFENRTSWWDDKLFRNFVTYKIASSGGRSAYAQLTRMACVIYETDEPVDNIKPVLNALKSLGGPLAEKAYRDIAGQIDRQPVHRLMQPYLKAYETVSAAHFLDELNHVKPYEKLSHVTMALEKGLKLTPKILTHIRQLSPQSFDGSISALVELQTHLLRKNGSEDLSDIILEACKRLYADFQNEACDKESLENSLEAAFRYFIEVKYEGAKPFAETCMEDPKFPEWVLIDVIDYMGIIHIQSENDDIMERIEQKLFEDIYDYDKTRQSALLAIGRISPARFNRFTSHHLIGEVFTQLIDCQDWKFFASSWINEKGLKQDYRDTVPHVSVCFDKNNRDCKKFAMYMGTKLSQFHCISDPSHINASKSGFIIKPQKKALPTAQSHYQDGLVMHIELPNLDGEPENVVEHFNAIEMHIDSFIDTVILKCSHNAS